MMRFAYKTACNNCAFPDFFLYLRFICRVLSACGYRILNESMLIVRDDAFCGEKMLVYTETNHPVHLALNHSRRGNRMRIKRRFRMGLWVSETRNIFLQGWKNEQKCCKPLHATGKILVYI